MDIYRTFTELKAIEQEGVDYFVRIMPRKNAHTVILAPHGGAIEPGTTEVARRIAGSELSFAAFDGMKSAGNACLHITSTNFDEPRCLDLVQAADYVVAIHGEGSKEPIVFLGGRDTGLEQKIGMALLRHGYAVRTHTDPELQGIATTNICNRGQCGAGVQLELSVGLRKTFFFSLTSEGRRRPTSELFKFADAVREGLCAGDALQPSRSLLSVSGSRIKYSWNRI